jgi:hypothetical protein
MKLYKIVSPEYTFADGETVKAVTEWQGTQADARKSRIAFEQPFKDIKPAKRPRVEVEEVDVPTDKAGLLVWLNTNAV